MRSLSFALLLAAAGLVIAGDAPKDAVKNELQKLKGTWQITSFVVNGQKPVTDEQLETVVTTIAADGKCREGRLKVAQ